MHWNLPSFCYLSFFLIFCIFPFILMLVFVFHFLFITWGCPFFFFLFPFFSFCSLSIIQTSLTEQDQTWFLFLFFTLPHLTFQYLSSTIFLLGLSKRFCLALAFISSCFLSVLFEDSCLSFSLFPIFVVPFLLLHFTLWVSKYWSDQHPKTLCSI